MTKEKEREQIRKIRDYAEMIANNCDAMLKHNITAMRRDVIREWGEKIKDLTMTKEETR